MWKDIYIFSCVVTTNTRLSFQEKVVNNAVDLSKHFCIFKLSGTKLCGIFCNQEAETIIHLFADCL